jgi:hypothetical protein
MVPAFRFERSEAVERLERLEQILRTLAHGPKRLDEGLTVALAEKNRLSIIARVHHVIEQTFGMNSRWRGIVPAYMSQET